MIKKIKAFFLKEQFEPSFLGIFINPFYFGRKALLNNIKKYSTHIKGNVLDIGCGEKPYKNYFNNVNQYVGMDVEISGHKNSRKNVDVFYDGTHFPFDKESFDSAICFEVLEHVFNPSIFISEIARILKKDGLLLITVPFVWDEHEKPHDFARYTSFGLKHLFETHGFQICEHSKYLNDFRLIFLLINSYIYKTCKRIFPQFLAWFFILLFSVPTNIFGFISFILPNNDDFYFGNIFVLKKVN